MFSDLKIEDLEKKLFDMKNINNNSRQLINNHVININ